MSTRRAARRVLVDALQELPDAIDRVTKSSREGACWDTSSRDLDVNLVAWSRSHGVETHVNDGVDVLVIGIRGRGRLEIDGRSRPLLPGGIHLIPRGARRAIRAETRLVYLTCHPRRARTFSAEELLGPRSRPAD